MDYISASAAYPSGFGTWGVTGGEGGVNFGSVSNVLGVTTSLSDNLLKPLFVSGYTVNSPAEPNTDWEYRMIYSVTVKQSTFGASGCGRVTVPSVHNSPNKTSGSRTADANFNLGPGNTAPQGIADPRTWTIIADSAGTSESLPVLPVLDDPATTTEPVTADSSGSAQLTAEAEPEDNSPYTAPAARDALFAAWGAEQEADEDDAMDELISWDSQDAQAATDALLGLFA